MGKIHRRGASAVVMLLVVLLGAASCAKSDTAGTGGAAPAAKKAITGGKLVVATAAEVDGFLPTFNRWGASTMMIARTIFDPLAALDDHGEAKPYLAESFTPNADFTEWVIKLRSGITFHDGSKLDADALKLHLEKLKESVVTGPPFKPVAGIERTDDLSVRVKLKAPWAQLPLVFVSQTGFVAAPAQLKANDSVKPIGTGPFVFKEWIQNDTFVALKNEKYWRKDKDGVALPYLDEVKFVPTTDPQKRADGVRNGDFNVIQTESPDEVIDYAEQAKNGGTKDVKELIDNGEGSEATVVFNNQTGIFSDRNLRIAAAKAVDKKKLVDSLFKGYFEVANGPFTSKSVWGGPDQPTGYDLEGAKALINDYKSAHGGQKPGVTIIVGVATDQNALGQYIQQAWNDAGFDAKVETADEKVITAKVVSGGYEAILYTFWDRPDPDAMAHYWSGENTSPPEVLGLNFARFKSDVVDDALAKGRATTDEKARVEQYKRVWNEFDSNQYILWLFHSQWVIAYGTRVQDIGNFTLPDGNKAIPVQWGNLFLTGVWLER